MGKSATAWTERSGRLWPAIANTVVAGMARVSAAAEAVGGASPFEKLTALALLCFDAAGVSWAVLETGLGGRCFHAPRAAHITAAARRRRA